MYLKLNAQTGSGLAVLLQLASRFRNVAVICPERLTKQYEKMRNQLEREFQGRMVIFDRAQIINEEMMQSQINDGDKFELVIFDDYVEAWMFNSTGYPKIPYFIYLQEFLAARDILMVVA